MTQKRAPQQERPTVVRVAAAGIAGIALGILVAGLGSSSGG
jgi:hypothetical protein